mmetsp:Transcript_463/g.1777  ORF Transcript_463/g.1777 Transcript_463/m.1777 type:complete len:281 (+) Transcript_463:406-1248(+)
MGSRHQPEHAGGAARRPRAPLRVDQRGEPVSHRVVGQDVKILGHQATQPGDAGAASRAVLRSVRLAPVTGGGHGGAPLVGVQPVGPLSAVQAADEPLEVPDARGRGVPEQTRLPGGLHRGQSRGEPRRRVAGVEKLHVQVPPRAGGHLRRERHKVPPQARHVRDVRQRRRVQLLGQGLEAKTEADGQVQRAHPLRGLQPRRIHLRLRRVLRLVQGRIGPHGQLGPEQHIPSRRRGRGGAAQAARCQQGAQVTTGSGRRRGRRARRSRRARVGRAPFAASD